MYRAIIIDDEQDSRETIYRYIGDLFPDITVVGEAENVNKGAMLTNRVKPDLVFLDINMPDGTGFELLQKIDDIDLSVIFITAFDHYAIKAFKVSAVDYLLKPVDPEMLKLSIEKFRKKTEQSTTKARLAQLLKDRGDFEKIALPTTDGYQFIEIKEIVHCVSEGSYTWFYTDSSKQFLVSRQIGDYEDILRDKGFYRVHQSHLINLNYVKEYKKGEGGNVVLSGNICIDVARRRKKGLLAGLLKYSPGV